jgi:hypothetical protein
MPQLPLLKPYWEKKGHFTIIDDLLLYDERLVIPSDLQLDILEQIHTGHLGMSKCKGRAQQSVWWPSITSQIEAMVNRCNTCQKNRPKSTEPLMPLAFPGGPWEHLGADMFYFDNRSWLIVVDYYSRWFEIRPLNMTRSKDVVTQMKASSQSMGSQIR